MLVRWTHPSNRPSSTNETVAKGQSEVVKDPSLDLTTLGLSVVAAAGFGLPVSVRDDSEGSDHLFGIDPNAVARFVRAFDYMITNVIKLVLIPTYILQLGPLSWRALAASFDEVASLIRQMMDIQTKLD